METEHDSTITIEEEQELSNTVNAQSIIVEYLGLATEQRFQARP